MAEYKVPYTFVPGTRAKASQVNANFDYLALAAKTIDESKANITGDATVNFNVAEPTQLQHAVTKRYVDLAIAEGGGGGGSGVGKAMFEVFHTLSTKTPPGAFSLRSGELILDALNTYPAFWEALQEQGIGSIPDFTDVVSGSYPNGYSASFNRVVASDKTHEARVFSPYSWFTSESKPTSAEPISVELHLPSLITCPYFRINSHVIDTYNSAGEANAGKAIKVASISVQQADDTWVPVVIINETEAPTSNERYFASTQPGLEFKAIRLVVAENFGAAHTDLSVYPVDPSETTVRVVPEDQWQWEVENFHETGAFVLDTEEETIRLPKITRFLSGVSDLWQVGVPESNFVSKSSMRWQEGTQSSAEDGEETEGAISLDSVSTGLWLQVFNAVSEDALANVKYVPHGVLFEEQLFSFIPDAETGWYVCDQNKWFDGNYFTDAMTLLMNQYASAVTPSGKNYKLAPNGMKFVTSDVYTSTFKTYNECPYYVLDANNYKFKVPCSNNYFRSSSTIDNAGTLIEPALPNITGRFDGNGDDGHEKQGAFYINGNAKGANGNGDAQGRFIYFDASRVSSIYKNGVTEVNVKSSRRVLCVFLGNEIPQSSNVNALRTIKEQGQRIEALEQNQSTSSGEVAQEFAEVKAIAEAQAQAITSNADAIENLEGLIEGNAELIRNSQDDITALQDKDLVFEGDLIRLTDRVTQAEANIATHQGEFDNITAEVEASTASVELLSDSVNNLEAIKADKTYVNDQLATKQVALTVSDDFTLDTAGNLALKISPVTAYTKDEVDAKVEAINNALSSKAEVTAITSIESSINTLDSKVSGLTTQLGGLSLVKITQAEYDALATKDENTLYVIVG